MHEKIRRVVASTTGGCRVDPEVGKKAGIRRDSSEHFGRKTLAAQHADRLMQRVSKDAGMTVGNGANNETRADALDDAFDHFSIGFAARLVQGVEAR